jgi:hypothetical protein
MNGEHQAVADRARAIQGCECQVARTQNTRCTCTVHLRVVHHHSWMASLANLVLSSSSSLSALLVSSPLHLPLCVLGLVRIQAR